MKHDHFYVRIDEWMEAGQNRRRSDAMLKIMHYLLARGLRSLEREFRELLQGFVGPLQVLPEVERVYVNQPNLFTTCLRMNDALVFLDIEQYGFAEGRFHLEVDIFAESELSLRSKRDQLIDEIMKCLGLTASKAALLAVADDEVERENPLRKQLIARDPIDEDHFRLLQDERERSLLRELKRRGSVLERDLKELCPAGEGVASAKETLDYLSGDEYRLVERKYAIVCRATQELVLPLRRREDFDDAKNLECPKCSKPFSDEEVIAFYSPTNSLQRLIDGSKWLPLLVRDAFLRAGLPPEDVYVEVKHGEDEIDVLAFYRERIIVVEAKNRAVNLNDAYKLSAKTAKLEAVVDQSQMARRWREIVADDEDEFQPRTA